LQAQNPLEKCKDYIQIHRWQIVKIIPSKIKKPSFSSQKRSLIQWLIKSPRMISAPPKKSWPADCSINGARTSEGGMEMRLAQLLKEARRGIGIGLMALTLIFALTSRAQAYLFDPDGAGALPAINIGSFDWGPTSFLAIGGTNAIGAFQTQGASCTTACDFTVLTQAKLIGTLDSGGNGLPPIPGLNSTFEITMVASLTERVTGITSAGPLNIAVFTTQPTGFLNIFFDLSPDSSQLTGSGFNDGTVILTGSSLLSGITGSFSVDTSKPLTDLDKTGANDYTGQLTVQGSGSQPSIPFDSLLSDPAFFTELLAQFGIQFSNISTGLPFDSVDPMTCFDATATTTAIGGGVTPAGQNCEGQGHVNGTYALQILGANGGVIPVVGTNNGLFPAQGGGPDFVAQTDFNSPLTAEKISEPASFLLFGFGLLGMGGYLRARTRKTK
jgi:hypothetical protein